MRPNHSLQLTALALALLGLGGLSSACSDSAEPDTSEQGVLRVNVSTSGVDLDPNGYVLQVGHFAGRQIPSTPSVELFVSDPGTLAVSLSGLAANCSLDEGPTTGIVTAGDTTDLAVAVTCTALPGVLNVSVATSGDDPQYGGYLVLAGTDTAGQAAFNGSTRLTEVPPGQRTISLANVASNCTVASPTTVAVTIGASAEAQADFLVTCVRTQKVAFDSLNTIFTSNLDGTGVFRLFNSPIRDAHSPVWSPDGTRVLSVGWGGGLYIADADGSNVAWLNVGEVFFRPTWSPEGTRLAFGRLTTSSLRIVTTDLSGGDLRELTHDTQHDFDPSWSPDGTRLVFTREEADSRRRLFIVNADGSNLVQLTDGLDDGEATWSPDGSWIAYRAQGPIEPEVRLVHPDGTGDVRLWPDDQFVWASNPLWSVDGSELIIRSDTTYLRLSVASRTVTDTLGVYSNDLDWRP